MTIQVGDKLPSIDVQYKTGDTVQTINTDELFAGKKVVVFALPGAFTPTCSAAHLPGYVVNSDKLFDRGIDRIICLSVNDAFVMQAWGEQHNVDDRVMMIADGSANFTRSHWPGSGPRRWRHGNPLATLCHDRQRWRGRVTQCRSTEKIRGQRRRNHTQQSLTGDLYA